MHPRILGIDPGLNITGYGVLEFSPAGVKLCEAGVIRGRSKKSLTARLKARNLAGFGQLASRPVADVLAAVSRIYAARQQE